MTNAFPQLNDAQLATHIAHMEAWARNYPVAAARPTNANARHLLALRAERDRRAALDRITDALTSIRLQITAARGQRDAAEYGSPTYWRHVGQIIGLEQAESIITDPTRRFAEMAR